MSNVNIRLNVTGQAGIQQLNAAIQQYNQNLLNVSYSGNKATATFQTTQAGAAALNAQLRQAVPAMNDAAKATDGFGSATAKMIGNFAKFYVLRTVFGEITNAIRQGEKAFEDYNYQASRVMRVIGTGTSNKLFAEGLITGGSSSSGRSLKDTGEVLYQLGTYFKDATTLASAFKDEMNLLKGTEGDARETTRLTIQMYEEFGDSLGKTRTQTEKLHGINEVIAVSFKDASAEVGELAQSLKYLGPLSQATNTSLAQTVASVVTLTGVGQRGRMAGTGTRSLLGNLLANYNEAEGGIVKKGEVYRFQRVFTKDENGKDSLDLYRTIENIVRVARTLPTAEAAKFLEVIGGSKNAVATLGAFGETTLTNFRHELYRTSEAVMGNTHELDNLAKTMDEAFKTHKLEIFNSIMIGLGQTIEGIIDKIPGLIPLLDRYKEGVQANSDIQTNAGLYGKNILAAPEFSRNRVKADIMNETLAILKQQFPEMSSKGGEGKIITADEFKSALYTRHSSMPGGNLYNDVDYSLIKDTLGKPKTMKEVGDGFWGANTTSKDVSGYTETMLRSITSSMESSISKEKVNRQKYSQEATPVGLSILQSISKSIETPAGAASCAFFASSVLKKAGVALDSPPEGISRARVLKKQLTDRGATNVQFDPKNPFASMQSGDVIFYHGPKYGTDKDNSGVVGPGNYGNHVAIYEGNGLQSDSSGDGTGNVRLHSPVRDIANMHVVRVASSMMGTGSGRPAIGDTTDTIRKKAEKAERERKAALQKRKEELHKRLKVIDARLEDSVKKKDYSAIPELKAQKGKYIALLREIAQIDGDEATLERIGRGTTEFDNRLQDLMKRRNVDARATLQAVTENELSDMSLFDPAGDVLAQRLDNLDASVARSNGKSEAFIQATSYGTRSKVETRRRDRESANANGGASAGGLLGFLTQSTVKSINSRRLQFAQTGNADLYAKNRFSSELDAPLNTLGSNEGDADRYRIKSNIADNSMAIGRERALIKAFGSDPANTNALVASQKKVEEFENQIKSLNRELDQLNENKKIKQFEKSLTDIAEKYDRQSDSLELSSVRGERTDTRAQVYDREVKRATAFVAITKGRKDDLDAQSSVGLSTDRKKQLEKEQYGATLNYNKAVKDTTESLRDMRLSAKEDAGAKFKGTLESSVMGFYHGQQNPFQIAGNLGNSIVETAIEQFTKSFTDGLSLKIGEQILALDKNTSALLGETPKTGAGNGTIEGSSSSDKKGRSGKSSRGGMSNVGYGLAAYGVLDNAMKSGDPLSGGMSGALAGFSIGGPVGAAVGGVIGLLGGLFGGKKKSPEDTNKDRNPGAYNTPGDFAYEAYRWRATGGLDPNLTTNFKPISATAPVVNVYLDNVKTAVQTEVSGQTSPTTRTTSNTYYDMARPK